MPRSAGRVRSPRVRSKFESKISASIQRVKIPRRTYWSRLEAFCSRVLGEGVEGVGRVEKVDCGWMGFEIMEQSVETDSRKADCWAAWKDDKEVSAAVNRLKNAKVGS